MNLQSCSYKYNLKLKVNMSANATKLVRVKVFGEWLQLVKLITSLIKLYSQALELHHVDNARPVDLPETYLGKIL